MERYAHITGWGMAVPERVLTNEELARMVDTNDGWIVTRTGIRERRIAGHRDTTASLALEAAQAALEVADLSPDKIDLIIVATSTPDHIFPATACLVQDALGATNAGAFDLSAACSGFIYAVTVGSQAIRSGAMQNILVIGSETMSRIVNWKDRSTCILFGDGAGAFVLQGSDLPGGVLSCLMRSDGSGGDSLTIPAGGSRMPTSYDTVREKLHFLQMNGKEVYRFATKVMVSAAREVVEDAGLTMGDIDLVVPHQANRRIVESAARSLNLPEDKFMVNVDRYGNTSAASIPIAVCEAVAEGRVSPNDHLLLIGFGAGLTWGATLVKWGVTIKPEISAWHHFGRQMVYGLAKIRSALRRGVRQVEGVLYGSASPENGNGNGNGAAPSNNNNNHN
jgi:3-oxoacyl-[acyl-carrier-protein] synthase III